MCKYMLILYQTLEDAGLAMQIHLINLMLMVYLDVFCI